MTEYRLDDLARLSGVSVRNIRAYRERGLLDPPRRVGRSAWYDDSHLVQLDTINQLLRRGFNSAHIAEFFASVRDGADLADVLGLRRADNASASDLGAGLGIDLDSDEARRLLESGLARRVGGRVVLNDPGLAGIVGRADDQLRYVRALLRIVDAAEEHLDGLTAAVVAAVNESLTADGDTDPPGRRRRDFREMARTVVAHALDSALRPGKRPAGPDVMLNGRRS